MPDELVITVSLHCRGEGEGRERGVQEGRGGRERGGDTGRGESTCPKYEAQPLTKLTRVRKDSGQGQLHYNHPDYPPIG